MSYVDAESIGAESDNGRIEFEHVTGDVVGITDNGESVCKLKTLIGTLI